MKTHRLVLAAAILMLFVATNAWAYEVPSGEPRRKLLDWPPVTIINERTSLWEVKVWAYPGNATTWQSYSCQTIHYNSDYSRIIEPWHTTDLLEELFYDHCGNYESLTFWFRTWNRDTGEYREFSTFGYPTPWGATWTWDGLKWTCSGC